MITKIITIVDDSNMTSTTYSMSADGTRQEIGECMASYYELFEGIVHEYVNL